MNFISETNRKWLLLTGLCFASFVGCIDFTIVNTALPAIQANLHTTVTQLQWIINIFILALSTFMVIMGRLADIYGRRLVFYIGMVAFGISSLGAGLAPNIQWLIFFRLIQGISCAVLYAAAGAIVSNAFPVEERGKALGILTGATGLGLAVGPVIGGIILSAASWRWLFLINIPVIILSLAICFVSLHESYNHEHGKRIDWLGLITLLIGLPCLILGITQGETWGWYSIETLSLFGMAVAMFILFYFIELKSSSPIIQFHLFANRLYISSIIATAGLAFFYCLAFFLMPLYLHNIRGYDGYILGLGLLPTTAMVALLSPIVGKNVDIYGPRIFLLYGFVLLALSAFLQTQFSDSSSLFHVISAFVLMGSGWACILGPSTVASLSGVPDSMGAVAIGSAWTMHNIGGSVGLALGIVIYRIEEQVSFIHGYRSTMLLLVASSLIALIAIFFTMQRDLKKLG